MALIKHKKTNLIPDWTQSDIDRQIALGNLPAGTTPAKMTIASDWNDEHNIDLSGLITAGANTTVIGAGTLASPFVISSTPGGGTISAFRIARVDDNGDDGTGTVGDLSLPYETLDAAMAAISDLAPGTTKGTIFIGVGTFSITVPASGTFSYDTDITIIGAGTNSTFIDFIKPADDSQECPIVIYLNNLTVNTIISRTTITTTAPLGQNGQNGPNAGNVTIYGDNSVYIGVIDATGTTGQNGGPIDGDSYTSTNGGNGGGGGTVTIKGVQVGSIYTTGGGAGSGAGEGVSGSPGGNGMIVIEDSIFTACYDYYSISVRNSTSLNGIITGSGFVYDYGGNSPFPLTAPVVNQSLLFFDGFGNTNSSSGMTADGSNIAISGVLTAASGIATNAYFQGSIRSVSVNTTISTSDYTVKFDTSGGSRTATLPNATFCKGRIFNIHKTGATNTLNFATTSSQTINGAAPGSVTSIGTTSFQSDGAGWIIL